ncbi:MAG: type II secretion system major pseudopilin GspG [Phycisphaerales bacterium JB063]
MDIHKLRRGRCGFTIVELLLVIVIIGILAGAVAVSLSGRSQEARIARAKSDLSGSLGLALDMFEQDIGRYPTTDEGLDALVQDPGLPNWKGAYIRNGLNPDPWGNPYVYEHDESDPSGYRLSSSGPDGQLGTDDDIEQ